MATLRDSLSRTENDMDDPMVEYLDLYHRTTPDAAERILSTGRWVSRENTQEVYFSTRPVGQAEGYGASVVHVRVPAEWCELDDEFPDGEQHYRVHVDRLTLDHVVP